MYQGCNVSSTFSYYFGVGRKIGQASGRLQYGQLNSTGNYGRRCVHLYVRIYFLTSTEVIKTL